MTVPELKARAKKRNIKGFSGMNKAQLIAALKKADASQS
ncbi:Rho termination factor N-terminal domain-containing protein [Trichocoleus sp. FACHB-69]|nr:Rho termination factor N-terminal domain-containing protein [Trichocoleus sp. FACHB-69]